MSHTTPPLSKSLLAKIRRYKAPFQPGPYQEAWLETMEANLHKQTQGQLWRKEQGEYAFCCLGLACEVLRENGLRNVTTSGPCALPSYVDTRRMGFVVDSRGWTDINAEHPLSPALTAEVIDTPYLFNLNDIEGWTFPQIAWLVRRLPDLYFTGPK